MADAYHEIQGKSAGAITAWKLLLQLCIQLLKLVPLFLAHGCWLLRIQLQSCPQALMVFVVLCVEPQQGPASLKCILGQVWQQLEHSTMR